MSLDNKALFRASTDKRTSRALAKSIKNDTEAIRGHTQDISGIKYDTERILGEIEDLRISLGPGEDKAWSTGGVLIEDYLDGLTSYAETVCEEVFWETEPEDEPANESEEPQWPATNAPMPTTELRMNDVPVPPSNYSERSQQRRSDGPAGSSSNGGYLQGAKQAVSSTESMSKAQNQSRARSPTPATKPKTTDGSELPQKSAQGKHCHSCGKSGHRKKSLFPIGSNCRHLMCLACIQSRLEKSLQSPRKAPRCCDSSVMLPRNAQRGIDSALIAKWRRQFDPTNCEIEFRCPFKDCFWGGSGCYGTMTSLRREPMKCAFCRRSACNWCFRRWHGKLGSCGYKPRDKYSSCKPVQLSTE